MFVDMLLVQRTNVRHIEGTPSGVPVVTIKTAHDRFVVPADRKGHAILTAKRDHRIAAEKAAYRAAPARRRASRCKTVGYLTEAERAEWAAAHEAAVARFGRESFR